MGMAGLSGLFQGASGLSFALKFMGGAFSAMSHAQAAERQQDLLRTRLQQEKAAAADRAATRAKKLNRIIGQQAVMAAGRGLGAGSSVFRQVSQDSFDVYHDDSERDRLNLSLQETGIKAEMAASRAQEEAGILGAFKPTFMAAGQAFMNQWQEEDISGEAFFGGGF